MSEPFLPYEKCPNCHEPKIRGLPCLRCECSGPGDMKLCERCGEVRLIVGPCRKCLSQEVRS